MFDRFKGFSASKLKSALIQSIIRIELIKNKHVVQVKKKKSIVAELLVDEKIEKARLEAEQIVRIDFKVEALDILELMCGMLRDNVKLLEISKEKSCTSDLIEPCATIFYCCERVDIPEFKVVKQQLLKKLGAEWFETNQQYINEKLKIKISGFRPNAFIVLHYLKEIAVEKGVEWEPDAQTEVSGTRTDEAMIGPSGSSVLPGAASGLGMGAYQVTDGTVSQSNLPMLVPTTNEPEDNKDSSFVASSASVENKIQQTETKSQVITMDRGTQTNSAFDDFRDEDRRGDIGTEVSRDSIPTAVIVEKKENNESVTATSNGTNSNTDEAYESLQKRFNRLQGL